MIASFRNVAVETELENQKSREVHQDIQRVGHGTAAGSRQDTFEKNGEYSQGQKAVGKRQDRAAAKPLSHQGQTQDKGQTQKIVNISAGPTRRDSQGFAQADQEKPRNHKGQQAKVSGQGGTHRRPGHRDNAVIRTIAPATTAAVKPRLRQSHLFIPDPSCEKTSRRAGIVRPGEKQTGD
jgi:hypothetical protein